jgi:hypothetical protein
MKIITDIMQGTEAWRKLRAGKFTGSEIHKLMGAKGFGQTGESYIYEVAASQETGLLNDEFSSYATERGKEYEEVARNTFAFKYSVEVEQAGAFLSDDFEDVMVSPDGFFRVENKGYYGLEIKCPLLQGLHLKYRGIKNAHDLKAIKPEYYWQVQMLIWVSEFDACYFTSFHPNFPADKLLHVAKIEPVENDINLLKKRLLEAINLKNKILEV